MIVTFPPRVTQELEPGPADVRGETGYRLATDWLQTGQTASLLLGTHSKIGQNRPLACDEQGNQHKPIDYLSQIDR